jgi:hypothetical protein
MRKTRHILGIVLTLFILSMATEKSLLAYADPGSGAMFVQIILAGFVGSLFRIRSIVKRFRMPKDKGAFQNAAPQPSPINDEGMVLVLDRDSFIRPSK